MREQVAREAGYHTSATVSSRQQRVSVAAAPAPGGRPPPAATPGAAAPPPPPQLQRRRPHPAALRPAADAARSPRHPPLTRAPQTPPPSVCTIKILPKSFATSPCIVVRRCARAREVSAAGSGSGGGHLGCCCLCMILLLLQPLLQIRRRRRVRLAACRGLIQPGLQLHHLLCQLLQLCVVLRSQALQLRQVLLVLRGVRGLSLLPAFPSNITQQSAHCAEKTLRGLRLIASSQNRQAWSE